jgi:hypothetical protein
VVVPLESRGIKLAVNLGDGTLLDLRRLGKSQNEGLNSFQLLAPVIELFITKFGTTIGGADQPVAEFGIVKLNWRKAVDPMDIELEEVVEEDAQRGLIDIGHDMVDGNVERVCATTEFGHNGRDQWELVEAEVGVRVIRHGHIVSLLVSTRVVAEVDDGSIANGGGGVNRLHEPALFLVSMESHPERTMPVDSLFESFPHSLEVDRDIRLRGDGVALVGIPPRSTETFHRRIDGGGFPRPGVVILELERKTKTTEIKLLNS